MKDYAWGERRQLPASARTGLSFQDIGSMGIHTRKQSGERRLPTPVWAISDKLLRELLVVFLETRVGLRPTKARLKVRMERARLAVLAQHPRLNEALDHLNAEYVRIQKNGVSEEEIESRHIPQPLPGFEDEVAVKATKDRLEELEIEVEGLDTYLRYTRNGGAAVLAQVCYLYFRVGLDSVGVATECGLKPPHVRQLLYRMNEVWKQKMSNRKTGMPEFPPEPLFDFLEKSTTR
jgi:hypothetical protein